MPPEFIPIETLVERALAYAKEQAPAPGVANWIGATAYTKDRIEYRGDGRNVIGHLYEMGTAIRRTGIPTSTRSFIARTRCNWR